jgi:cytochrome c oxidase subunit 3
MHFKTTIVPVIDIFFLLGLVVYSWFRDIVFESPFFHSKAVQQGLRIGFLCFVFSEVMVFFGLFWALFAFSLVPPVELGCMWPPIHIMTVDPFEIPLLNTLLLLLSGAYVTWSHHALINGDYRTAAIALFATIALATIFTLFQLYEYVHASFSIADGVYGSVFYFLTGCHGLHVIVGTGFLAVNLVRLHNVFNLKKSVFAITQKEHLGYEFAIWYWHFVDVVWLFLYIFVYCSAHTLD